MLNNKLAVLLIAVAVVVVVIWMFSGRKESFTWANNITDLSFNETPGAGMKNWSMLENPTPSPEEFANYVGTPDPFVAPNTASSCPKGEGYSMTSTSLDDQTSLPLPDLNTTPEMYDISDADPQVFMWNPSVRAQLKPPLLAGSDYYRGDLPIIKTAQCSISRYGYGDSNLNGMFSEQTIAKYKSLTGQESFPIQVANEETICDYNPTVDQLLDAGHY